MHTYDQFSLKTATAPKYLKIRKKVFRNNKTSRNAAWFMHARITIVRGICVRTIHPHYPLFNQIIVHNCIYILYFYFKSFIFGLKIEYKSTVNHLKTRLPSFFDSGIVICDHLHRLSNHKS